MLVSIVLPPLPFNNPLVHPEIFRFIHHYLIMLMRCFIFFFVTGDDDAAGQDQAPEQSPDKSGLIGGFTHSLITYYSFKTQKDHNFHK